MRLALLILVLSLGTLQLISVFVDAALPLFAAGGYQ